MISELLHLARDPNVQAGMAVAVAALALLVLILLIGLLAVSRRLRRLRTAYTRLTGGLARGRLDEVFQHYVAETQYAAEAVRQLRAEQAELATAVRSAVQRVGMVRYSAYADTGGDQSFAVALLDREGNGALFNGLFHRSECRVYAKPVEHWRSPYTLTDEEEEAIRKARQG